MDVSDLLTSKVSFQSNAWSPISREMTLAEVLKFIKNGEIRNKIERLREFVKSGDLEQYDIHKKSLPAITFSGTFNRKRQKSNLLNYNYLLVIDIDKLEDAELTNTREILLEEDFVFTFWESPSKKGLKGLIFLEPNFEINLFEIDTFHEIAFNQVSKYFKDKFNILLDSSGKDTTRLCFFSYDETLTLKETITPFIINEQLDEISKKIKKNISIVKEKIENKKAKPSILHDGRNKNNPFERVEIQFIIRYLAKNKLSITYDYEDWYRVAFAIASSFTYEVGLKYFLKLSEIDTNKYDKINCENMLLNAFENNKHKITYKTIQYLATKVGYKIMEKRVLIISVPLN